MSEKLTGIQRDVVIQYIRTDFPLIKVCSGRTFEPVFEIPEGHYTLQQTAIVFPKKLIPSWMYEDKIDVRLFFYFRKRGLQFDSVLQSKGDNAAIGIADSIEKVSDEPENDGGGYTGRLYYKKQSFIPCVSSDDFPLFNPFVWKTLKNTGSALFLSLLSKYTPFHTAVLPDQVDILIKTSDKILYLPGKKVPLFCPFPFAACFTESDIQNKPIELKNEIRFIPDSMYIPVGTEDKGSGRKVEVVSCGNSFFSSLKPPQFAPKTEELLAFLPAVSYLSDMYRNKGSVEDRIEPIEILYITDEAVCFGCPANTITFTERQEYIFSIQLGFRTIITGCVVKNVLEENKRIAAVCRFTNLKPEDKRFLYEKQYKSVLSGKIQRWAE